MRFTERGWILVTVLLTLAAAALLSSGLLMLAPGGAR